MTIKVTVEDAIEVLNRAFAADPEAIRALVSFRVPCNDALADDPTVQVKLIEDHCEVGLLGMLNGIFGTREGGPLVVTSPGGPRQILLPALKDLASCRMVLGERKAVHARLHYVPFWLVQRSS